MKQAIADAQLQEEIPVVTVLSDCSDSARKTLIETDPYDLGRAYARGIIRVTETRSPQITIFMNNRLDDSFLQGIGYGMAESLLRAVSGGEIAALLYIDAQQTGMMCVDALNGYLSTGSIRDHITVEWSCQPDRCVIK